MISTYSFQDVICTLNHNALGTLSTKGEGLGSITIDMADNVTEHDRSADGSVMVSKVEAENGTITIDCQQTSQVHKWLKKWYNYLKTSSTKDWIKTNGRIVDKNCDDVTTLTGISPQKLPSQPYQQTGQHVTWTLMVAKISVD